MGIRGAVGLLLFLPRWATLPFFFLAKFRDVFVTTYALRCSQDLLCMFLHLYTRALCSQSIQHTSFRPCSSQSPLRLLLEKYSYPGCTGRTHLQTTWIGRKVHHNTTSTYAHLPNIYMHIDGLLLGAQFCIRS